MYAEFVGLTERAVHLIEELRQSPKESRSDILIRVLSPLVTHDAESEGDYLDLGEGVRISSGEKLVLFLSRKSKQLGRPDGVAEAHPDGLYMSGIKIPPSRRGNALDPAMKIIQKQKNHRNDQGEIISLSAWRQWHVLRDGKFVPLVELKDPQLARTRGRRVPQTLTLEDLGL